MYFISYKVIPSGCIAHTPSLFPIHEAVRKMFFKYGLQSTHLSFGFNRVKTCVPGVTFEFISQKLKELNQANTLAVER